jgi:hypothetical protein
MPVSPVYSCAHVHRWFQITPRRSTCKAKRPGPAGPLRGGEQPDGDLDMCEGARDAGRQARVFRRRRAISSLG